MARKGSCISQEKLSLFQVPGTNLFKKPTERQRNGDVLLGNLPVMFEGAAENSLLSHLT